MSPILHCHIILCFSLWHHSLEQCLFILLLSFSIYSLCLSHNSLWHHKWAQICHFILSFSPNLFQYKWLHFSSCCFRISRLLFYPLFPHTHQVGGRMSLRQKWVELSIGTIITRNQFNTCLLQSNMNLNDCCNLVSYGYHGNEDWIIEKSVGWRRGGGKRERNF